MYNLSRYTNLNTLSDALYRMDIDFDNKNLSLDELLKFNKLVIIHFNK